MKERTEYAFAHGDRTHGGDPGITLRDYFAGQALAGMAANPFWDWAGWERNASGAYLAADAMMKAREASS